MRRLIRWAVYLLVLVISLVAAGILLLDRIVREVVENRIRATTGMSVEIGKIDVGLLSPTISIQEFKLYNTPDFGGSIFIDMPELYMEYDPLSIRAGTLRLKLVRLDLAEVGVVQDKKGRSNFQDLEKKSLAAAGAGKSSGKPKLKFTGIDTFNLTLGKLAMTDLASGHETEINFGIKNQLFHNVKSEADVAGMGLILATRGGLFSSGTNSGIDLTKLLRGLTGK